MRTSIRTVSTQALAPAGRTEMISDPDGRSRTAVSSTGGASQGYPSLETCELTGLDIVIHGIASDDFSSRHLDAEN